MRIRTGLMQGAVVVGLLGLLVGVGEAADLTIGNLTLVDTQRVSRTEFTYTYRGEVTNTGPAVKDVTATVRSTSPDTVVVTNALTFGEVPAGGRVLSSDTFAIRQNRLVPFNPAALVFEFHATLAGPPLPPDPATVAPAVDPTVATSLFKATEFLYTGTNPIQTGVAPGTIVLTRAAVVRGKVSDRTGAPLPGVQISILQHPEFGQTLSRADGMFDLALNGGGPLVVQYAKDGFLPAQRTVVVPWQDFAPLPDVALIPLDPRVTTIDLSPLCHPTLGCSPRPMQVARGSVVTDGDGARQATLLFPTGTIATVLMPDGTTRAIDTLSVRATEYTVGANGPAAMPAELPPTSAYTYAAEFRVDEAQTAGAVDVLFNPPLPFYVENFLKFPVGVDVPLGSYDRKRGAWVPSDNGRVLKILSVTGGLANLDLDGSGTPAAAAALSALGITDAERQQLASLYAAGQSLWRMPIPHFDQPWDANQGIFPPPDAISPNQRGEKNQLVTCPVQASVASTIECQNQVLGEAVGLVGTPFRLHYQSERAPGRRDLYTLEIPLSVGVTLPPSLKRIDLEVLVAGRRFTQSFPPAPGQRTTFTWDGQDAYGRPLQGAQPVTVRICYVYNPVYQKVERFGYTGNGIVIGVTARRELALCQVLKAILGTWDARAHGLGGWSLSVHHAYDPTARLLYQGNGVRRSTELLGQVITTVAGSGRPGFSGDGGPATLAQLSGPHGVAVAPDGSFYVMDTGNDRIRRVDPTGTITTVAISAPNELPEALALGPDGSLYFAGFNQVHRVGPDGVITTVAGTGVEGGPSGDGGPAIAARLQGVKALAVAPDGTLYIGLQASVRRVGVDGIITTVAGNGVCCTGTGDGGPATQAQVDADGVAIGPDGSLYVAGFTSARVRRVRPDGIITTVAGTGNRGFSGDGGPATQAVLCTPSGVAVAPDGSLYISDVLGNRIRRVATDGIIISVAGSGPDCTGFGASFGGDGGPAVRARLFNPFGVAAGPDGSAYIADFQNSRIRRVAPALPGLALGDAFIPAEDGSEIYVFPQTGRHLRTVDALTGALRYQFTYDTAGRLAAVTDAFGNVTTIERDVGGNPLAIVAPFGQRTALALEGNGYLASITNPANESVQLSYTSDGLLTTFTDPRTNVSRYSYDAAGRLTRAEDAAGGATTLARTDIANGFSVALTTALGRTTTYQVERLPTGDQRRLDTFPDGTQTELMIRQDGTRTARFADGTVTTVVQGPDPRFGMQAPVLSTFSIATPGGLSSTATTQRSATLANPFDPLSLQSLTETVNLNGRTFTRSYSGSTRTLTDTTAQGRQRTITLDAFGRVTQVQVGGLVPVTYGYDVRGRLATALEGTGPDARTLSVIYNAEGYPEVITDPLGRTGRFGYDAVGRITQQTLADGRVIPFTYDAIGNVATITPPGRPAHTFAYTPVNLGAEYTPPDVGAGTNHTLYSHDADRQLTRTTRPDSQVVDLGYDAAGRPGTVTFSRGQLGYGYSATTGNLSSITAPDGLSVAYAYDGALVISTAFAGLVAGSVGRTYDNNFRIVSQSVNGGNPIAFSFDLDSLLAQGGSLTLARNAQNGLVTGTTLGNLTDGWGYNGFGERISYNAALGGSPFYTVQFTRDTLGRISQKTETIGGITDTSVYAYDLAGRLTEVAQNGSVASTYTYDSNGNRLTRTRPGGTVTGIYDAQDRLTQYGNNRYTYTANGELLTKTVGGRITTYRYDELSNLVGVTLPTGTQIDYVIDGASRRLGKRVNGTLVQGFLYADPLKPIAELDGASNVVSRFVYARRANVPAYMVRGGVTYRIVTDHLGSPRLVIDAATGQIVQRMDYDEFGNVTNDTNPGFQPFGFAGGLYDRDSSLVRFGLRDYDAETGRWTSKDLIGFLGGDPNLYRYVHGDPVNRLDSLGLGIVQGYDPDQGPTYSDYKEAAKIEGGPLGGAPTWLKVMFAAPFVAEAVALVGGAVSDTIAYFGSEAAATTAAGTAVGVACPTAEYTLTVEQAAQLANLMLSGRGAAAYMIIRQVAAGPGGRETLSRIQDMVVSWIPIALDNVAQSAMIAVSHMLTQFTGFPGFWTYPN